MSDALRDKTTIVTGAGSGIGRAATQLFAEHGAQVAALDVDEERGQAVVDGLRDQGRDVRFFTTDVSQARAVEAAVQGTVDAFGGVDVLFNVVGVSGRKWGDGPVAECTEEAWDRVHDINLKSMFLCCKYAVREMLEAGRGSIINLSSVLGLVGGDEDFATHAYAASKGGVISFTRSIASYYAPENIRANVICPGLIATRMSRRAQSNDAIVNRLPELQPLTGAFGQPEDVAHAALYLASDQSGFVTGTVLPVDGGWTVR
jgi:NAD(P)-dependent dehydrogenase (short-subunit alcohol dehydrogenase family)